MSDDDEGKNPDKAALFDSVSKGDLAIIILELLESMTSISRMMGHYMDGSQNYRAIAAAAIEKMLSDDREMVVRNLLPEIDLDGLAEASQAENKTGEVSIRGAEGKLAPYIVKEWTDEADRRGTEAGDKAAEVPAAFAGRTIQFDPGRQFEESYKVSADGTITRVEGPRVAGELSALDRRIKRALPNARTTLTSAELRAAGIPVLGEANVPFFKLDTILLPSSDGLFHMTSLDSLTPDQKLTLLRSLVLRETVSPGEDARPLDWLFDDDAEGSARLVGTDDDEAQAEDDS